MADSSAKDIAGVIAPPPLVYMGGLIIGLVFDGLVPLDWPWPASNTTTVLASLLGVLGIALGAWQAVTFKRADTPIPPYEPTRAIAAQGPYRFTRNPAYISQTLLYLALTFAFGGWWCVVLLIPTELVIHFGVVLREERYLERKFGEDYLSLKRRVRRWI